MLEALKSQDLLILGTEDEADTEEEPGESLSKFQNVIEQFIEQNSPETSKSTADYGCILSMSVLSQIFCQMGGKCIFFHFKL